MKTSLAFDMSAQAVNSAAQIFPAGWKDKKEKIPPYKQIVLELEANILSGAYNPGGKLPTVRALAEQYKVSPNTTGHAISKLKRKRLLVSRQGSGIFITNDAALIDGLRQRRCEDLVCSFFSQMKNLGYSREQAIALLQAEICGHG